MKNNEDKEVRVSLQVEERASSNSPDVTVDRAQLKGNAEPSASGCGKPSLWSGRPQLESGSGDVDDKVVAENGRRDKPAATRTAEKSRRQARPAARMEPTGTKDEAKSVRKQAEDVVAAQQGVETERAQDQGVQTGRALTHRVQPKRQRREKAHPSVQSSGPEEIAMSRRASGQPSYLRSKGFNHFVQREKAGAEEKVDAETVWKEIEDVVAPQLQLSVIDHVIYFHLLRHSRLEGRRELRFSIPWLSQRIRLSVSPTREGVRRLAMQGVLRLTHRSKTGHVVEVLLPREIPGIRIRGAEDGNEAGEPRPVDIEEIDFTKTRELRRSIHEREGGKCFYCLRKMDARLESLDHVVPRVKVRCNSYRNLVSACMECNSQKGEQPAEEYLRWLFREHRLGAAELRDRFQKMEMLTSGKLRPKVDLVNA